MYPAVAQIINQISIPSLAQEDQILWKHSSNGDMPLKEAYEFKFQQFNDFHWATTIWSKDIPPSKSMFVWRFMHNKIPTDDNLMYRGCQIPSMCSICFKNSETSFHLFFECSLATKLWSWLANSINIPLQFSSKEDIWKLCDKAWSP